MTINQISEYLKERQSAFPTCKDWSFVDWSNAIAGEVGELCNQVKKFKRSEGEEIYFDNMREEIADVICYCIILADKMNLDLNVVLRKKINKVSKKMDYAPMIEDESIEEKKAKWWDDLDKKISEFYPEETEEIPDTEDDGGDLIDVGEAAAIAFGYM